MTILVVARTPFGLSPQLTRARVGKDPKQSPTKDEVLDDFTLYWLTKRGLVGKDLPPIAT